MILQTGMRTDIPAFYSEWFANRIREGYVLVRNPYNPVQVTRYEINPAVVDLISFCSKNPGPMLEYMNLLKPYGTYWFVTITAYGADIEPNVPSIAKVVHDFQLLSDIVGADSMGWRYDPILINETYTIDRHLQTFEEIASALDGYTHTCVISFIDLYDKVRRNFPEAIHVTKDQRLFLGERMTKIAAEHGMVLRPCSEGEELARFGADCSGCMTQKTFETALHNTLNLPKKKALRNDCACFLGNDIGAYNTCPHLCRYCYANYDEKTVRQNYRMHDPKSPFLVGHSRPEDIIHQAEQKSWIDGQMELNLTF